MKKKPKLLVIGAGVLIALLLALTPISGMGIIETEPADSSSTGSSSSGVIAEGASGHGCISPAPSPIWYKIPIENCGLAGVTEADIEQFYADHADEINEVATYISEYSLDEILEDIEAWIVVQGSKEPYAVETFRNLVLDFGTMVDCSQADYDGDGIPDDEDPDDDNDGIPDQGDSFPDLGRNNIYKARKDVRVKIGFIWFWIEGWLYHYLTAYGATAVVAIAWELAHEESPNGGGAVLGVTAMAAALGLYTVFDDPDCPLALEHIPIFLTMMWQYADAYESLGINPYHIYNVDKGVDSRGWIDLDHNPVSPIWGLVEYKIVPQS